MESKIIITVILCTAIIFSAGCIETKQENYGIDSDIYVLDVSDWIIAENTLQRWNLSDEKITETAEQYEKNIGTQNSDGLYKINYAEIAELCGLKGSELKDYIISFGHHTNNQDIENILIIYSIAEIADNWNILCGLNLSESRVSEISSELEYEFAKNLQPENNISAEKQYRVSEKFFIYRFGVLAGFDDKKISSFYRSRYSFSNGIRDNPVTSNQVSSDINKVVREFGTVQDKYKIYFWQQSDGLPLNSLKEKAESFGISIVETKLYPDGKIYCWVSDYVTADTLNDENWKELYDIISESTKSAGIYDVPVTFWEQRLIIYPY